MNVFVAAWYYPPVTSSEGIVTYKLLRKSENTYDVCSSLSENWSYHTSFASYDEANINTYTIDTDSIETWVEFCINKFEELYPERKYECIMTRSTPPESILVGLRIKELHPEVKWIASLADPVANNPYEIKRIIDENPLLSERARRKFKAALVDEDLSLLKPWKKRPENGVKLLCKLKEWEDEAIHKADLVISPTERQLTYINGDAGWRSNYFALPHSYSKDFYPLEKKPSKDERIVFTYTGYSDALRTLNPIVEAVLHLERNGSPVIGKFLFRFIGNIPSDIKDKVYNFDLQDSIQVEAPMDYFDSLSAMVNSDWLIHVDAVFPELQPGNSIFFAGKIADYIGTGNPILALTGKGSPACSIIEKYGGIVLDQTDISGLADTIEKICLEDIKPETNKSYADSFEAANVARRFDKKIAELCRTDYSHRINWPVVAKSSENKILSISIPSYNVQHCLDRCLHSLVSCKHAPEMEIIVVDDGSKDKTLEIARDYERHYPGIVKAIHKENGGHGSTINTAIKLATGKYFKNVDSDDWVDSSNLDKLIEYLKTCEDIDVVSSDYDEVDLMTGKEMPVKAGSSLEYGKVYTFNDINVDDCYFTIHSMTIRTQILKEMGIQLQEHTFFVDCEYILFPVPYINKFVFLEDHIYKYSKGNPNQSVDLINMVRRYDHHERVMRRVILYRNEVAMSESAANYYDSILKRLLHTHYNLCTVYDSNRKESYIKLKAFDEFLKSTDRNLAEYIGRTMPVVRIARKVNYNYSVVKVSPGNIALFSKYKMKEVLKNNKHIAKKILMNKYTYMLSESAFFTKGKGAALKNKVFNIIVR